MSEWQDEVSSSVAKLIVTCIIAGLIITAAIFVGGPILAVYILINGWDKVRTRVIVGAIGLPLVGAAFVIASLVQTQSYTWDWLTILFVSSPFISLGLVGIAYSRVQRSIPLPALPEPELHLNRMCAHCGNLNRAGFKYCNVCGRPALDVTHPSIKP
ncbi:MAG TPA: zinc ribbon domain-containing protein [Anaerolineae bacterium]|nr:zinc ribbon domain-containing protein [Anaerolineae bacterium]